MRCIGFVCKKVRVSPDIAILIGQYSQNYYLGDKVKENLTATVKSYKIFTSIFYFASSFSQEPFLAGKE
jgi:uracil-DNA glycosylase